MHYDKSSYLIAEAKEKVKIAIEAAKEYCQDKLNPLDDRWEIYLKVKDWLEVGKWNINLDYFSKNKDFTYYHEFEFERRSYIGFLELYNILSNNEYEQKFGSLDLYKEEILSLWKKGFIYDW